ncbi:hypothetical protein GCM10027056_22230 [Glaciibacter psychrotolerans]
MAHAWANTTHRRGARHASSLQSNGFTVADLRAFVAAVNEAQVSDVGVIRIDKSNLSESGRLTVTMSVEEQYEPDESEAADE